MNTTTIQRDHAKKVLFEALKTNGGDTNNEIVVAAIEKLALLNPNSAPLENGSLHLDDELRITRGNRETVLICQRQFS